MHGRPKRSVATAHRRRLRRATAIPGRVRDDGFPVESSAHAFESVGLADALSPALRLPFLRDSLSLPLGGPRASGGGGATAASPQVTRVCLSA